MNMSFVFILSPKLKPTSNMWLETSGCMAEPPRILQGHNNYSGERRLVSPPTPSDMDLPWDRGPKRFRVFIKRVSRQTGLEADICRRSASTQGMHLQERTKGGERRGGKMR